MTTPHEAADKKETLTGEYSLLSDQLLKIKKRKPSVWMAMRAQLKSDKATDRAWEASEMGLEELELSMKIKRIEKEISSMNSIIKVFEGEARNLW